MTASRTMIYKANCTIISRLFQASWILKNMHCRTSRYRPTCTRPARRIQVELRDVKRLNIPAAKAGIS